MKKIANTKNMSHQEWLEMRKIGIGGSDASKVLGVSRYGGPIDVWVDKTSAVDPMDEETEVMHWGNVLEEVVAKEFELRTGMKVKRCNNILQHDDHPWMIANIDREIVGQKAGLECKTASEWKKDEWENDEIPAEYIIQCQHYMAVTGYKTWWIAVLIGGNKFVYKQVERDEELIAEIIKAEAEFWECYVEPKNMPPIDGSDYFADYLNNKWKSEEGAQATLDANADKLLAEREALNTEMDDIKDRIQEIDNLIKGQMQDSEKGYSLHYEVSWKTSSRNSLDSKKLKADHPDLYSQYTKASETRTYKVKKIS